MSWGSGWRSAIRALAAAGAVAIITGLIWNALRGEQKVHLRNTANVVAASLTRSIHTRAAQHAAALQDLGALWARFGHGPRAEWQMEARILLAHRPGFEAIAWISSRGSQIALRQNASLASDTILRQLVAQAPTDLERARVETADASANVLLAYAPAGGRGEVVAARLPAAELLDEAISERSQGFAVSVTAGGRPIYRSAMPTPAAGGAWSAQAPLGFDGAVWILRVAPTAETASAHFTPLPFFVLGGGLLCAALVGGLVWEREAARRHARQLTQANEALETEVLERHRAEEEVRTLNRDLELRVEERTAELQDAVSDVEAMNYAVSHDLRSPLGAILNFATILREDYGDRLGGEGLGFLERVQRSALSAVEMINSLLAYSRAGRRELKPATLDVNALVHELVESLEVAGLHDARFEVHDLPTATADPWILEKVFEELLTNALKFSRRQEPPRISVAGQRTGSEIVYSVTDNGPGFDAGCSDKLFRPFEKLHTGEPREGQGVGLAIIARAVRRHGGRIWAVAEPGGGATFSFALPAEPNGGEV